MKKPLSILTLLAGILLIGCKSGTVPESNTVAEPVAEAAPSESNLIKKYQIKSGIINFDTKIAGIEGKTILYFDNYGSLELEEKYTGDQLKEGNLCDGTNLYSINFEKKTAYKASVCSRGVALKVDWNEISDADKQDKAKKLPNVTVAGKDCESFSYTASGVTSVFAGWNNICVMQEQSNQYGGTFMKAVSIEENVSIPAEKFAVPEGFEMR